MNPTDFSSYQKAYSTDWRSSRAPIQICPLLPPYRILQCTVTRSTQLMQRYKHLQKRWIFIASPVPWSVNFHLPFLHLQLKLVTSPGASYVSSTTPAVDWKADNDVQWVYMVQSLVGLRPSFHFCWILLEHVIHSTSIHTFIVKKCTGVIYMHSFCNCIHGYNMACLYILRFLLNAIYLESLAQVLLACFAGQGCVSTVTQWSSSYDLRISWRMPDEVPARPCAIPCVLHIKI